MGGWISRFCGPNGAVTRSWRGFGGFCLTLRRWWVLWIAMFAGAVAAASIPRLCLDSEGRITHWASVTVVTLGIGAAIAVILDKVADSHASHLDSLKAAGQEQAGVRAVIRVSSLLEEIHKLKFETTAKASGYVDAMRYASVAALSSAPVAEGVRASYYRLNEDSDGSRELVHLKSFGRSDDAITKFVEKDDPNHEIWARIAELDTQSKIRSAPEPVQGVQWDSRPYKTFVTVPIKAANKVTFGMLTMNALEAGDLTELDRVCAIAVARVLAMGDAILRDHKDMNTLAAKEVSRLTMNVS
ncbi:hypothetical protein [Mycobacteroides abscessus]|uniref:hypothetical protein n=1 Tax=Mycobacteroides abscessus TaxID=36809 RepID=UPI0010424F1F|nr:hypothetical protein [Mycobacteroides abscessus]